MSNNRADTQDTDEPKQSEATKSLPPTHFLELEKFLRKFLFEMTLEATDGNVKLETLDYVTDEHLTRWAVTLADLIEANHTFTVHGEQYELASYSDKYSDGSRRATIRLPQRLSTAVSQDKSSKNANGKETQG